MSEALHVLRLTSTIGTPASCDALGDYLIRRLWEGGALVESSNLQRALRTREGSETLWTLVSWADLVVLAFPQRFGTPPFFVVHFMEVFPEHRDRVLTLRTQHLLCLVSSSPPQRQENEIAISVCEQWAHANAFVWEGGFAFCGDDALGKSLQELGSRARNITRALDLAVDALWVGDHIPSRAFGLMARPIAGSWRSMIRINRGIRHRARTIGTMQKLNDAPFG